MFVDEVDVKVLAGNGGNGCVSFRREKWVPRGGPNGGNGGHGGSIYLRASDHHNTLVAFRFNPEFKAQRGEHGMGSDCTGADGKDLILEVPPGTVVYEHTPDGFMPMADLTEPGQQVLIARGGRGGRGNAAFLSNSNRAPRRADPGEAGEERMLRLQLKLLADVGLVGYPNAGKSTLISRISAAKPKIANYPFTTLSPNLGVVTMSDDRSFVVADVPGLIEGAHSGLGLGTKFLAHLERTKVLAHVIDVSSASGRDPVDDFNVITRELELFEGSGDETAAQLSKKPRIVVANKIDALDEPDRLARLKKRMKQLKVSVYPVSAATGQGIPELLEALWQQVNATRNPVARKKKPRSAKKTVAKKAAAPKKKATRRKKTSK
ncbi:MAG: GTPase ObgE [Acidobacteria bacterium]|nr:MAG: GTPase ObgE [Acidobacteriota bacterium]